MNWTTAISSFLAKPHPPGSWALVGTPPELQQSAIISDGGGHYKIIAPDGALLAEPLNLTQAMQLIPQTNSLVSRDYKQVGDTWVQKTYGGTGSDQPSPIAAAAPPTAPAAPVSPTPAPPSAPTAPIQTATVNPPPAGMVQVLMPGTGSVESRLMTVAKTSPLVDTYGIYDATSGTNKPVGTAPTPPPPVGGAGTTGGTVDYASQRASLNAAGIDTSQLSDTQIGSLFAMNTYLDARAKADKVVVPPQLTASEMGSFLNEAKGIVDPYYAEQLMVAKNDLAQATAKLTGDFQYEEKSRADAYQAAQDAQAAQMAEAGLARSGIRQKAEARLAEQNAGMVQSGRRQAAADVYRLGSGFEGTFGKAGMAGAALPALPTLDGGAPITYNAQGIALGTQGSQQATAEQVQANQLATNEIKKRYQLAGLYGGEVPPIP